MKASIQRRDRRQRATRRKKLNGNMQLPQIQAKAESTPRLGENELPFIRALPNGTHMGVTIKVSKEVWTLGAQFIHNFNGRFLIAKFSEEHVEVIAATFAADGEPIKHAEEHVPNSELPAAVERVVRAGMAAMKLVQ